MGLSLLHVSGNKILDAGNNVVMLRGVNSYGESFACETNQGGQSAVFGGASYLQTPQLIKSWGANCVRISLCQDCWMNINSPFTSGNAYKTPITNYIQSFLNAGIYVILTIIGDSTHNQMADANTNTMWGQVASQWGNTPGIIYDLFNEPHDITFSTLLNGGTNGGSLTFTAVGMQALLNTVRTYSNNLCLVATTGYSADFSSYLTSLPTDSQNNFGASWHAYTSSPPASPLDGQVGTWFSQMLPVCNTMPMIATEMGGYNGDAQYITTLCNFLDTYGAGYMPWAWAVGSSISVLSAWDGTPSTYGVPFRERLLAAPQRTNNTRSEVIPTLAY